MLKGLARLFQVGSLGIDKVGDDQLDRALGVSVWVCRPNRAVLGNGYHVGYPGRIAIDGGRGREDDIGDIVLLHASQESDGPANIHTVVLEGDLG